MSRSANVQSIQTLRDFKVAMIKFGEDARNALSGVEMDLRKMRDWLERDQLGYWQMQIKRRNEELMQARADLHRRKISQQGSDAVSDTEQKEALREATRRLRVAEEKVALIKRLIPQLHHAIAEYHSHSQPLGDHLSGGFEKSLSVLERMILSLEAYVGTTGADGAADRAVASTSGAATTTGAADHVHRRDRRPRRPAAEATAAATGPQRPQRRGAGPGRRGRPAGEELIMSAKSGRLQHALKTLREKWDIATETWDDPASRDFEKNHIVPLEQTTKHAIIGMEKLSEVLGKIRAQCKED